MDDPGSDFRLKERPPAVDMAETSTPAIPTPTGLTPSLSFCTRTLPPRAQFAFWQACNNGLVDVRQPEGAANAGFAASGTMWRMGGFALSSGESDPCHYSRTARHIRRDSVDHWVVSIIRSGQRRFCTDGFSVINDSRAALITSFDRPYETDRSKSAWLQLYIPRDSFPDFGPMIDAARYQRLDTTMGHLLKDYISLLPHRLPDLTAAETERLAEATRAMVAACIQPSADHLMEATPQIELVQLAQVKRLIRQNLSSAMLGPDRLWRQAGVSRSKLYRLFEPFGGVARFIQTERLKRAHAALCDPADRRSIGRIAEDVGLFDLSSFGRMFRTTYGVSPRELRLAAAGGGALGGATPIAGPPPVGGLLEMLRSL